MILAEDHSNATYQIKSYSPGKVVVNNEVLTQSFVISPTLLIKQWAPLTADSITDEDLLLLADQQPEVILLGTAERSIILPAHRLAVLLEKQFHVECMSVSAACRTYIILASENRRVIAGIIL